MKKYSTFRSANKEINEVQEGVRDVFNSIYPIELLNGYIPKETTGAIKTYTVTTGGLSIEHGLNRVYQGYIIVYQSADARIWVSSTTNSDKFLTLTSSATVTIKLFIF